MEGRKSGKWTNFILYLKLVRMLLLLPMFDDDDDDFMTFG